MSEKQSRKSKGKQLTRREVLKTLGAATVLAPATSLLWQGGIQAAQQAAMDTTQIGKVIDKALTDHEFRKAIKVRPVQTLVQEGIKLPPKAAEALTKAMKQDPNALRKAILGESSPLTDYYATESSVEIHVLVISVVVIGVLLLDPGIEP